MLSPQALLDRLFQFRPRLDGEPDERVAREYNAALEQMWPGAPDDLVLRTPGGRGKLALHELVRLITPGDPGALTVDKLARRIAGVPDASSSAPERSLRLNQVTVPVTNLARSIEFYRGLGLTLIVRDEMSGYARFLFPDGGSTLSVHVADRPITPSQVVIYFECDDLDARHDRLTAAGYRFTSPPTDQSWLWREATLVDPDGQQICLFHAGANRKDPPWRLVESL